MQVYDHQFEDYDSLVSILLKKGMAGDPAVIARRLEDVGYQRLSSYWKPFEYDVIRLDIEKIWDIYCFDRALRRCLLDAIERIEVAFRNKLVHLFTRKYGPFGYIAFDNYDSKTDLNTWSQWLRKIVASCKKSKHDLVTEYVSRYSNKNILPLWIVCELMDFGSSVHFFEFTEKKIRQEVSQYMTVRSPDVLLSWIKLLNDVRNSCAHHNRIWNKKWSKQPAFPDKQWEWYSVYDEKSSAWIPGQEGSESSFHKNQTGVVLTICCFLLNRVASTSRWKQRVFQLFDDPRYKHIPLSWMGLPEHWSSHPIWSQEPNKIS